MFMTVAPEQEEPKPANGESSSPAAARRKSRCPEAAELLDWWEHRDERLDSWIAAHVAKCPRCAHDLELAHPHADRTGVDEGLDDSDMVSLQPALEVAPISPREPQIPAASPRASGTRAPGWAARLWQHLSRGRFSRR